MCGCSTCVYRTYSFVNAIIGICPKGLKWDNVVCFYFYEFDQQFSTEYVVSRRVILLKEILVEVMQL